jgi:aromatic ring-cleaving dioxygenase
VYVPKEDLLEVSMWFQQHRAGFSVLVHPNSGCGGIDQSEWAFWLGESWHLYLMGLLESKRPFNPTLDAFYNPITPVE